MDTNLVNLKNAVNRSVNINKGLPWSAGTYTYGALIRHQDMAYVCIADSTTAVPTDPLAWSPIGKGSYLLDEIADVDIVAPNHNDFLLYDEISDTWQNQAVSYTVSSLSDISLTGAQTGDVMTYNGLTDRWENKKIPGNFRMNFLGPLEPVTSTVRYYPIRSITVKSYFITAGGAPNAAGNLVIKKNNVTVTTVSVPSGTVKTDTTPLSIVLSTTDYLTVDSTLSSGKDLSIIFIYE
jgi:hypothetical protein